MSRVAAVVSHNTANGSFLIRRMRTQCPFRPSSLLQSGQSAEPGYFVLECSEAAGGDLTHPAMSRRSRFVSIAAIRQNVLAVSIPNARRSVLSLHMRTIGSVE